MNGFTRHDIFYIKDNGIGIEERNREKMYRIFARLNPQSQYGPGTGAGLSFVRKIVEGYGNDLTFMSQPGQGTTFYFSVPLAQRVGHDNYDFIRARTDTGYLHPQGNTIDLHWSSRLQPLLPHRTEMNSA